MPPKKRTRSSSGGGSTAEGVSPEKKAKPAAVDAAVTIAALQASVASQLAAATAQLEAKKGPAAAGKSASTGNEAMSAVDKAIAAANAKAAAPKAAPLKRAPESQRPAAKASAKAMILRLDDQGREIDEDGNLIQQQVNVHRTVNISASTQRGGKSKKAANPYLAHLTKDKFNNKVGDNNDNNNEEIIDVRIHTSDPTKHTRKAFSFIQAGEYIEKEKELKEKADHRAKLGHASGRKAPQMVEPLERKGDSESDKMSVGTKTKKADKDKESMDVDEYIANKGVPMHLDGGIVPCMEWWDVEFLPKSHREELKLKAGGAFPMPTDSQIEGLDKSLLSLKNSKSHL